MKMEANWILIFCMAVSILLVITVVLAVKMKKVCRLDSNKDEEIAYLRLTVQHLRGKQNYGNPTKNSSRASAKGAGAED